jgi:hypothetical protein
MVKKPNIDDLEDAGDRNAPSPVVDLVASVEVDDSSLSKNAVYVVTALWLCA